jgi:hypothetical protein
LGLIGVHDGDRCLDWCLIDCQWRRVLIYIASICVYTYLHTYT